MTSGEHYREPQVAHALGIRRWTWCCRGWKWQTGADAQSRLKPPDEQYPFEPALRARVQLVGTRSARKGIMASGAWQGGITGRTYGAASTSRSHHIRKPLASGGPSAHGQSPSTEERRCSEQGHATVIGLNHERNAVRQHGLVDDLTPLIGAQCDEPLPPHAQGVGRHAAPLLDLFDNFER